ncbi:MAG: polyribonucleotide nucleotidyltransferase [Patescibacteria group bacterium]|nr:polyribonucleotide nucleotidyltransferase [Patescibacteria group bacterium]
MKKNTQQKAEKTYKIELGEKIAELTFNKMARQANGSVLVKMGGTVVLGTATMSAKPNEEIDYFPLFVEYEENYWAAGKIRGSRFMKRKGRPTDEAVLTSRLIDRSIRPLFPKGMKNEVQIVVTVLSFDFINDPRPLALLASSAALEVSDIPFEGPLAATYVGENNNKLIVNPTIEEQEQGKLDIFITGVSENISMVEAGAKEASEEQILEALALGQTTNTQISEALTKIGKKEGQPKTELPSFLVDSELKENLDKESREKFEEFFNNYKNKQDYEGKIKKLKDEIAKGKPEEYPLKKTEIEETLDGINKNVIQTNVLKNKKRLGNRAMDEVRPISIDVSVLPYTHGSSLFTRGETQGLTVTTLGSPDSELILDGMSDEIDAKKRYLHYYSFPPYSTGECGPMRGPGRREIGHGALGEKALASVIPSRDTFPYTMVMQTEIMASDGSTSMASVCGSTLALMDAGVPITSPVSGVAMGLIVDSENKKYQVLTDLCANEDFAGHMDFKVAGTKKGITALQMDIKVKGLSFEILKDALKAAKKGRLDILKKMLATIDKPREEMSPHAPRVEKITINPDQIRDVIGPGGKVINSIIEQTKAQISVEDDGTIFVTSNNQESMKSAIKMIESITKIPAVGEVYSGKVTRIMEFGAFVEFLPKREGLVHISKLGKGQRVNRVADVVNIGDKVKIKIDEIDNVGRFNLGFVGKEE